MKRILIIACTIAVVLSAAGALVAKEITVKGRLQKTVESGGWLIAAGKSKYLILNASNFQKETWFKESAEVEAVGDTKPDVITTYMEGTPFEVRTMHPVEQTGASVDTGVPRRITRVMVAGNSIVQEQDHLVAAPAYCSCRLLLPPVTSPFHVCCFPLSSWHAKAHS